MHRRERDNLAWPPRAKPHDLVGCSGKMAFELIQTHYRRHERWLSILFFGLGFAFDALILRRIDEPKVLVHQAVYIALCAGLIALELVGEVKELRAPPWLARAWGLREWVLHFMLGTLLNAWMAAWTLANWFLTFRAMTRVSIRSRADLA